MPLTIYKDSFEEFFHRFIESFGYDLKVIWHITDRDGISFKQDNKPAEIIVNHFAHFGEKS